MNTHTIKLAGKAPPSEFRLFKAGTNFTTKGTFTFDEAAAKSVMATYQAHGVDLMIDLEHQALDVAGADPAARDARGWFQLEVRNGELWAVNVRWSPDGEARLANKTQRYISPAFKVDEDGRITEVINAALVAMPATHQAPALVAASKTATPPTGEETMTLEEFLAAIQAADLDPKMPIADAIAAIEGAEPAPDAKPKDAPGDAKKPKDAPPSGDAIAAKRLMMLTATSTLGAAAGHVEAMARELQAVSFERDAYENAERVRLCSRLVVDAGHAPAGVWQQFDSADKPQNGVPKVFLQKLSIAELRAHVEDEIRIAGPRRPGDVPRGIRPPAQRVELSDREKAMCAELKIDPKDYAARKAVAR